MRNLHITNFIQEIKKESTNTQEGKRVLVGTFGTENDENFIELFKIVSTESDVDLVSMASLRGIINAQRKYKLFYLITDDYEYGILNEMKKENEHQLVEYLDSCKRVKSIKLYV